MNGRFKKAPVTIVSLKLHTSALPNLGSDQLNDLKRRLLKLDLVLHESAEIRNIQILPHGGENATVSDKTNRHGFFNATRTESLFLDIDGIEWRVTKYFDFDTFNARVQQILEDLETAIDFLPFLHLKAVTLKYSDLIVPYGNRKLSDYFKKKEFAPLEIKPLCDDGEFTFGMNQFTRIFNQEKNLTVSMEEYPYAVGQPMKIVHDSMLETHPNFSNSIQTMSHWNNEKAKSYGIMLMQAVWTKPMKLSESNWSEQMVDLNNTLSTQFVQLLNREVCDQDWEYEDGS